MYTSDVDECLLGDQNCPKRNATCRDSVGYYDCVCAAGYYMHPEKGCIGQWYTLLVCPTPHCNYCSGSIKFMLTHKKINCPHIIIYFDFEKNLFDFDFEKNFDFDYFENFDDDEK